MAGITKLPEVYLLLAAERSGTHFLRSMLAKAPGVVAPGEVCNPRAGDIRTSATSFLRFRANASVADEKFFYATFENQTELLDKYVSFVRASTPKSSHVILDVKYSHVHNFDPAWWEVVARPLLLDFAVERGIRIIHLVREKPYRTVISNMFGQESGVWHVRNANQIPELKLKVDRGVLQARTLRLVQTIDLFSRWLQGSQKVRISYENLINETETSLAMLREFLALKVDIPRVSEFIKTISSYDTAIENFSDIEDLIDVDLKDVNIEVDLDICP